VLAKVDGARSFGEGVPYENQAIVVVTFASDEQSFRDMGVPGEACDISVKEEDGTEL
jgi:hypothetical protein